jgi:hypothetical protein
MLCKRRRRDPYADYEQGKEPAKVAATLHIQTVTLSRMEDNGRCPIQAQRGAGILLKAHSEDHRRLDLAAQAIIDVPNAGRLRKS